MDFLFVEIADADAAGFSASNVTLADPHVGVQFRKILNYRRRNCQTRRE